MFRERLQQPGVSAVTQDIFAGPRKIGGVKVEIWQFKIAGLKFAEQVPVFVRGAVDASDVELLGVSARNLESKRLRRANFWHDPYHEGQEAGSEPRLPIIPAPV